MSPPVRVLIVDDSVVIRRLLSTIIEGDPDLEVAGMAQNGRIALERVAKLKPDVVTLDIEMPEMNGLETLVALRKTNPTLPIIMFSTLTARGAEATLDALSFGASDYVTKPANVGSVREGMDRVRDDLIPKIKNLCRPAVALTFPPLDRPIRNVEPTGRIDVLAIGSSTGGPNALSAVLTRLPADLPVPIVIVQHMPPVFTKFLASRLDDSCAISVGEGEPGVRLEPGCAWIAPGDFHMTVTGSPIDAHLSISQGAQENYCRPAVDVLFRSVTKVYGGNVLAVILTGMGSDGRSGCVDLKERGAHVIVQDKETSVVWGMPGAVASAGLADDVLPLEDIAPEISRRVLAANTARSSRRN